jgi:hypothetical protein
VIVHAGGDLAQTLEARDQVVLRRLAAREEAVDGGVARLVEAGAVEGLHQGAVLGGENLRHRDIGVAPQPHQPPELRGDHARPVIGEAPGVDPDDLVVGPRRIAHQIDPVFGFAQQRDRRFRRKIVAPDEGCGFPVDCLGEGAVL